VDKIKLEGCEFTIHPPLRTAEEIISAAEGAEILCMRDQFGKVTAEVFESLPELKLVITRSAGYDHIDLEEAKRRGIPVCFVPDYGAHMIAEHAFGLILAVARNIVRGNNQYKNDHLFSSDGMQGMELRGKTLGVVGTGRIGLHCVQIANGFGMKVIANDVYENKDAEKEFGFEYVPLNHLLENSNFISIHLALNESTQHLINGERLAKMKKDVVLVNTARGGVVDTKALMESMRLGHVAGAGLDVLEDERDVFRDFEDLNVIITPHLGWYTDGAVDRILKITMDDISGYMNGKLVNLVEKS
ncbi:MAG: hypothetical protein HOF10_06160, partial [Chloroflexi bacterium]|nr:hypothetical protein [Chloroflexota bacterium]